MNAGLNKLPLFPLQNQKQLVPENASLKSTCTSLTNGLRKSLRPKLQLAHPPAKNKENSALHFTKCARCLCSSSCAPKTRKKYKRDTNSTIIVTPVITEPLPLNTVQDGSNTSEDCSPRRHKESQ